jgi:uncharacterized protein with GYD domain
MSVEFSQKIAQTDTALLGSLRSVNGWMRHCFGQATFGKMGLIPRPSSETPNERSFPMATFITTIKFTEKGIKAIGETTKRADAFKAAAKKMGAKVTEIYWTLGEFDGAIILDAPDAETAAAVLMQLDMSGNVHTTTVRAFNAAEMGKILAKLSQ